MNNNKSLSITKQLMEQIIKFEAVKKDTENYMELFVKVRYVLAPADGVSWSEVEEVLNQVLPILFIIRKFNNQLDFDFLAYQYVLYTQREISKDVLEFIIKVIQDNKFKLTF